MRVVLVHDDGGDETGRRIVARRLVPLAAALAAGGDEVVVAVLGHASYPGLDHVARVVVVPHAVPPSWRGACQVPLAVGPLGRLIEEVQPDVVQGHQPFPAIAVALAARRTPAPLVTYWRHHHAGSRELRIASRTAARLTDATFVSCPAMRDLVLAEDRVPPDRVFVSPPGDAGLRAVSAAEVADARARLGIGPDDAVVAAVARLRRGKGIDVLLAAIDRLAARGVHVVVAGDGPERDALGAAAGDRVHLLGHVDDIALVYAMADLVAIPSRSEAFGRTAVEAMAAGRAVVASRVGGLIDSVQDGVTGVLVEPGAADALAAAVDGLLADDGRRAALGRAARERFERLHTIEAMAASMHDAWGRAMAGVVVA